MGPVVVLFSAKVNGAQDTGWQVDSASSGEGAQSLVPGAVPTHEYTRDGTTLVPPPMEKPLAQIVVIESCVTPLSEPPEETEATGKFTGGQEAAAISECVWRVKC